MKTYVKYTAAAAIAVTTLLGGTAIVVAQDAGDLGQDENQQKDQDQGKDQGFGDETRPGEKPADQGFGDEGIEGQGEGQRAQIGMPAPDFTLQALDGTTHSLSQYRGKILVLEWFDPSSTYVMKHHKENKTMKDLAEEYRDDDVAWLAIVSGKISGGEAGFPGSIDPSGRGGMGGDHGGLGHQDHGGMGQGQDQGLGQDQDQGDLGRGQDQGDLGRDRDQGLGQGQDQGFGAQQGLKEIKVDQLRQCVQEWEVKYPVLLDRDGKVAKQFGAQTVPSVFIVDKQGTLVYMGAIDDDPSTDEVGGTNYIEEALEALIDGDPIDTPVTTPYGDKLNLGGEEKKAGDVEPNTPSEPPATTPPSDEGTTPNMPPAPPSK